MDKLGAGSRPRSRFLRFLSSFAVCAGAAGVLAAAPLSGCAASTTERLKLPPLQTVASVDLEKYAGTWYEIASFPQRFQEGCTGTTATYTRREDGEIGVLNRCRKFSLEGEEDSVEGRARVVDAKSNARLEVSFFRPFWGDYWIIDLAPDYSFAVVGHPGRDYLWILSRTPAMDEATYAAILARLTEKGYETARLRRTIQPAGAARGG
jgi:apolipoprotein D and lipocalin family protein